MVNKKIKNLLYFDEDQHILNSVDQAVNGNSHIKCRTENSVLKTLNNLGLYDFDMVLIGDNGSSLEHVKNKSRTLINFLNQFEFEYKYYILSNNESDEVISKIKKPPEELIKSGIL